MTNLGKDLRQKLAENFSFPAIVNDTTQISSDGTLKSRFKTHDGHFMEGVLIPTENRNTACVSSQIGCSLTCSFCATGKMERKRNLDFDEIYDQVAILNEQSEKTYNKKLSNMIHINFEKNFMRWGVKFGWRLDGCARWRRVTITVALKLNG